MNTELLKKLRLLLKNEMLNLTDLFLLYTIQRESLIMTEISVILGQSTAGATTIVDKLESMGCVKRVLHPSDRRKIIVAITNFGVSKLKKFQTLK